MKTAVASLLKTCDELIRAGHVAEAAALVRRLNLAQVERDDRLPLARIFRRAGLINLGIKLLSPIIRSEKELSQAPTLGEICEYAALLTRIGLVGEALGLLEKVDSQKAPEAELFLSYGHIMRWDYEKAIPHLNTFIAGEADPYRQQIAQVNLASALVATRQWSEAESLLNDLIHRLRGTQAQRLLGNCLELRSQIFIQTQNTEACRQDLSEAGTIFSTSESYDQLLVRKWLAYLGALKSGSPAPLKSFRALALKKKHWESVREADLLTLKIRFDQELFDHLYLGTPHDGYRRRIQEEIASGKASPRYDFGGSKSEYLDLLTGQVKGRIAQAPPKKVLQLLGLLMQDFYVPTRVGPLFAGLYPGEYFDMHSSPLRVRQILRRTRRWLESQHLPIEIQTERISFRLTVSERFAIRVPNQSLAQIVSEAERLKEQFAPAQEFLMNEACDRLGISRSSFHRLAQKMIDAGEMKRIGVGKATRYKVA